MLSHEADITDEQIEALRDEAEAFGDTHFALVCRQALGTAVASPPIGVDAPSSRAAARARCAEVRLQHQREVSINTSKLNDESLDMPSGLDAEGRRAHEIIVAYLRAHGRTDTGGCKAFYAPSAWRARGEQYGAESHLVVVYDGGALRPVFSMDAACDHGEPRTPYALYEGMQRALREVGLFFEECTTWYCAVYDALPRRDLL